MSHSGSLARTAERPVAAVVAVAADAASGVNAAALDCLASSWPAAVAESSADVVAEVAAAVVVVADYPGMQCHRQRETIVEPRKGCLGRSPAAPADRYLMNCFETASTSSEDVHHLHYEQW